jgi:hypothetical protein
MGGPTVTNQQALRIVSFDRRVKVEIKLMFHGTPKISKKSVTTTKETVTLVNATGKAHQLGKLDKGILHAMWSAHKRSQ